MEKLGIDNIIILTYAVAESASKAEAIFADGRISVGDWPLLPGLVRSLSKFGDVSFRDILPEAKDLDEAEKKELAGVFKAQFNIEDDNIEDIIETGFAVLLEALSAVLDFVNVGKKIKGGLIFKSLPA